MSSQRQQSEDVPEVADGELLSGVTALLGAIALSALYLFALSHIDGGCSGVAAPGYCVILPLPLLVGFAVFVVAGGKVGGLIGRVLAERYGLTLLGDYGDLTIREILPYLVLSVVFVGVLIVAGILWVVL